MTSVSKKTFSISYLYQWTPFALSMLLMIAYISAVEAYASINDDGDMKDAARDYLGGGEKYGPIRLWDTSRVTNTGGLFENATSFNGDLGEWNVSNVTDMWGMFINATSFNGDISRWDVSNVSSMWWMFYYAQSFNGDLGEWDVSNVTDMWNMFNSTTSFNSNLNQWDVSKVTDMEYIFYDATSFNQQLCWDVSSLKYTSNMFTNSPGSLAKYPECISYPSSSPTTSPTVTPTTVPSLIPSNSPTAAPITTLPPTDSPFSIMSGLSTDEDKWCIYPANNYLSSGTKIVIGKCKNWQSYTWTVDYEGKIKNVKDPSLCIHMQGKRVLIETCVDGLHNQIWRYSSHRTLMIKNGRKGAVVEDGVASEKAVVKNLEYLFSNQFLKAEIWDLQYVSGHMFPVTFYNTFRIVSDLTTDAKQWCIYPATNSVVNGMKLVLSTCKTWDTFKWMMDNQGRINNVKDPTKCITRLGKRIQLNDCINNNIFQRWVYGVIDKKISALVNGQLQATVEEGEASVNTEVRSSTSEVPGPSYQKWELEEI